MTLATRTITPSSAATARARGRIVMPAWPLILMIAGFPLWWALGASAFSSLGFAAVMVVYLLLAGRARLVPGLLPFFALLLWVIAASVTLTGALQAVGYVQRFGDLAAAGIAMLYYVNAPERLTARRVIGALTFFWGAVIVLGVVATQFPDVRLTTPVGLLFPDSLTSNPLVRDLVFPRLAEVQQPYGAPEPFNRPAAPFPYANSWGAAYAILTPVALAYLSFAIARWKRAAVLALLVVSVYPALETSNRGMLLAIAISVVYVIGRLALRGRLGPAVVALVGGAAAVAGLVISGALDGILGRQEYSDSTQTRTDVYLETFRKTLESPLLGWATPQDDVSIGIALGTQGQAWLLMFSYGFVGLGLFLVFLYGAILRTVRVPTVAELWLHGVLVMIVPVMWFYSLGSMQMLSVALIAAILLRARARREVVR